MVIVMVMHYFHSVLEHGLPPSLNLNHNTYSTLPCIHVRRESVARGTKDISTLPELSECTINIIILLICRNEVCITSAVKHRHPVHLPTFLHCSKTGKCSSYTINSPSDFSKWFYSFLLKLCNETGKPSCVATREKNMHIVPCICL